MNSQWVDTLFLLEERDVEAGRVVDQREPALRSDQLGDLGQMHVGARGGEHDGGRTPAQLLDLARQWLGVVDDMMRAQLVAPGRRLGP